jgi:hypothetical protein
MRGYRSCQVLVIMLPVQYVALLSISQWVLLTLIQYVSLVDIWDSKPTLNLEELRVCVMLLTH